MFCIVPFRGAGRLAASLLVVSLLLTPQVFAESKKSKKSVIKNQASVDEDLSTAINLGSFPFEKLSHTFGDRPAPGLSVAKAGNVLCVSYFAQAVGQAYGTVCGSKLSAAAGANILLDPRNISSANRKNISKVKRIVGAIGFPDINKGYASVTSGRTWLKAFKGGKFKQPRDGSISEFALDKPIAAAAISVDKRTNEKNSTFFLVMDQQTGSAHLGYADKTGLVISSVRAGQPMQYYNHHISTEPTAALVELIEATLLSGDKRLASMLVDAAVVQD